MISLYLDTSEKLVWGVLDSEHNWIIYQEFATKQPASSIHSIINQGLAQNSIELKAIDRLFVLNGPGSYTGIRIAEGIAQIFEWQKTKVFSFYAYEVPSLCGIEKGVWFGDAFKGEFFRYDWGKEKAGSRLFLKLELDPSEEAFFHFEYKNHHNHQLTSALIHKSSKIIFTEVLRRSLRHEPLYYRSEDVEFKVSKP